MKKRIRSFLLALAMFLSSLGCVQNVFAATATGTMVGPEKAEAGETITLSYIINAADIEGGQGTLTYDSTKAELISVNSQLGSAWSFSFNTDNGRFVYYDKAQATPINSETVIFTATFKLASALTVGTKIDFTAADGRLTEVIPSDDEEEDPEFNTIRLSQSTATVEIVEYAAQVEDTKYELFTEAVSAATGSKVITLLKDVASYELSKDETLKVNKNGLSIKVTAPEGFRVAESTQDGITTYTICTHNWVEESRIPATCEKDGTVSYKCSICGDTKEEPLAALDHDYQFSAFEWDGYTAKAVYVCKNDAAHTVKYDATVTDAITTAATCESAGVKSYTAAYDGHTDTKDETLPALDHDYQFSAFEWDGYTAKAVYVCKNDAAHTAKYEATVTDEVTTEPTLTTEGVRTYTATYDGHTETKTEVIPKKDREVPDKITSNYMTVDQTLLYISKVTVGTTNHEAWEMINEKDFTTLTTRDDVVCADSDPVCTGHKALLKDGDILIKTYLFIVTGDVNGDGEVTITDLTMINNHLLGKLTLEGVYWMAADINNDGEISITDLTMVNSYLLGKMELVAH